jgi:hypothetical protein
LHGLINIEQNGNKIHIQGLCVPGGRMGVGSRFLSIVKSLATDISTIDKIDLTCYGTVHNFYKKNGFEIVSTRSIVDSDDEDEPPKIRYSMILM